MRVPWLVVLGVLATVAGTGGVSADTYYVDRDHPSASDGNPGSEASPWATIQHAADTVGAGDTVLVKQGTYPEQVTISCVGTAVQSVVFAAYPGHTVTVDGASVPLEEWAGLLQMVNASYVTVRGFHVTNSGPWGTNPGIQVDPGDHIVIENNHTSATASSGILIWSGDDIVVAGNEIESPMTAGLEDSRNECITVGRTANFEVRDNHVHDNTAGRGEGICLKDGSSYGSVHHNHVHHVPNVGIYLDAWSEHTHHIDVWSNRVHDVEEGSGIVLASERGGLLESVRVFNNLSYHNTYLGLNVSANGDVTTHPMVDIEIVNNSVWGNGESGGWGGGLGVDHDQWTGLVIRNNAFAGNFSFEITFESVNPSGATIDHNLIDDWDGYPGELCGTDCQLGDPLWVDPASGDFHLQVGSPAIDHGSALLAPGEDFEGTARPQGSGHDIGADELGDAGAIFADGFESGGTDAWS